MPNCTKCSTARMFADDTNLTASGSSVTEIKTVLNKDIECLVEWLCVNKLTLNVIKTEYMLIGSRQRIACQTEKLDLYINNVALKQSHAFKCLRLTIDDNLTFKIYIENVIKKVKRNLSILLKAKPLLNQALLKNIYYAIIEPYFTYCSVVWDSIDKTLADKLQKLQNRAARIITSASYYTVRTHDMFSYLKWSTLDHKRKCQNVRKQF